MRCFSNDIGVIAQLVEHYVRNVGVAGSNPTNSTSFEPKISQKVPFGAILGDFFVFQCYIMLYHAF